jgi:hypothetical protein
MLKEPELNFFYLESIFNTRIQIPIQQLNLMRIRIRKPCTNHGTKTNSSRSGFSGPTGTMSIYYENRNTDSPLTEI